MVCNHCGKENAAIGVFGENTAANISPCRRRIKPPSGIKGKTILLIWRK